MSFQPLLFSGFVLGQSGGGGGSGTVTSVGLSLPGIFTVSGSPVTTTGTLTGTLVSQSANTIFAAPNGSSGTPTFRLLVAADIPSLSGTYATISLNNLTSTAINAPLTFGPGGSTNSIATLSIGSGSGNSNTLNINTGNVANGVAGALNVTGGTATGTGTGGAVVLTGGTALGSGTSGTVSLIGGSASTGTPGDIDLTGGSSNSANSAGFININGGTNTSSGNGGTVVIFAGSSTTGPGGNLILEAGNSNGSQLAGSVNIVAGGSNTGTQGSVIIQADAGIQLFSNLDIDPPQLQFFESTNSFFVGFQASNSLTTNGPVWTLPLTDGSPNQFLQTNGLGQLTFAPAGTGTVTSVSVVNANGLAGTVATSTSTPAITLSTTITGILKGNGTAISAAAPSDFPTLNQNTTGTSSNVTGVVAVVNGGTSQTTTQGAINVLVGATTSGFYLRGNGSNVVMSAIQVADVPTLNQNTSGTAANITASSNSTLTTLSSLSLPTTQLTGTLQAAQEPAHTGDVTNTAGSLTLTIAANAVTNAKAAQMATLTIKGNNTGGTANVSDLTVAQVNAILPVFTSTLNGLVPLSGGGTTNFLRADGTFTAPAGTAGITALTGDVTATGPGSVAATLATIASAGTTGSSTAIPVITINAKGLTTSITTAAVIAPAGTLSGTTLNSTVVTSSLTSLGTQGAALNMGSHKITSVTDPTSAQDAATKNYVDNALAGINPAVAVQAATTSAANTSALTYNNGVSGIGATFTGANNTALIIDGFTFTTLGQRLLVKNDTQSPSGAFNGIYYVTQVQALALPLILTRALDYDQPSDINNTGAIPVINGTVNGTTQWVLTSLVNTVGTDPLTFTQFARNPADYLLKANNLSDVSTKATSFNNISPVTSTGDLIYSSSGATNTRLPIGTSGQVLTVSAGVPTWQPAPGTVSAFFASSQVTTNSSNVSGGTFTTFSNSPAFTFTPTITGTYKVYSSVPIESSSSNNATVRIFNTSGSATLLQEMQAAQGTAVALDTSMFVQSNYTLTAGVSYTFDVQGLVANGGAGTVELVGTIASFYMFAELEVNGTTSTSVAMNVYLGSNQAVTANSIIKYDSIALDTNSGYSASTGLYTVPASGVYSISVLASTISIGFDLFIKKNGTTIPQGAGFIASSGSSASNVAAGTTILLCAVNDTIGVYSDASTTFGPNYTQLSICKMGS